MPVLFQYAWDDGPLELHNIWLEPVEHTRNLIRRWLDHDVVGFNLAFDWFHVCKLYTLWELLPGDWLPIHHVDWIANLEADARDGPCVKPAGALDLLLHSRKTKYQSLMSRSDVRIRKVPAQLANQLAQELEERVDLDAIYFAKSKGPRWRVYDRRDNEGDIDPRFKDVVLKFNPAGGLKHLAQYALGAEVKHAFADIEPSSKPFEKGWAPFATAFSSAAEGWEYEGKPLWPRLIREHVEHWATNEKAREYARDDIVYTRALCEHFGNPPANDDDSVLACLVGAVRWHGFKVDLDKLQEIEQRADELISSFEVNTNKPSEVRRYLSEAMDDTERLVIEETTNKGKLEKIRDSELWQGHPAQERAALVLDVKAAHKERDVARKLRIAGRFHAAFSVIGAKSARMSGTGSDGLNPQGIKSSDEFRSAFPLAWEGMQLSGGDFDSFELTLMDAVYNDAELRRVLQGDKKLHALFAEQLTGKTYAEVMESKGSKDDLYSKGKRGVFGRGYGADAHALAYNLGISEEHCQRAIDWFGQFRGVGDNFKKIHQAFGCLNQPTPGGPVYWNEPQTYVESFLGFRRDFSIEIEVCRALFTLAQKPPGAWRIKGQVNRGRKVQTPLGAVSSALYGAAFQVAGGMERAAANHEIQSPGGQICKAVQRAVWDLQPAGVNSWVVAPMNVHDELMCPVQPAYAAQVEARVQNTVATFRQRVPLIAISWKARLSDWSGK